MANDDSKPTILADRWEILRPLGSGGMGTVYLARDLRINRNVAIKVLDAAKCPDGETTQLAKEVDAARALAHPNIVRVFEAHFATRPYLITMEFLDGDSLERLLERGDLIPRTDALVIIHEVAEALDHAHEQDVHHLDIKPQNVMVLQNVYDCAGLSGPFIKVIDFGVARLKSEPAAGLCGGTAPYAAPECYRGHADRFSDVFSLGMMAFRLLTSQFPFRGQFRQPDDTFLASLSISDEMNAVIERAVRWNPTDRWPSASEFAAALIQAYNDISPDVRSVPEPSVLRMSATTAHFIGAPYLKGVCIFCKREYEFEPRPSGKRFCCMKGLPSKVVARFQAEEDVEELFPTIFPVPVKPDVAFEPPLRSEGESADAFAISFTDCSATRDSAGLRSAALPSLPYPTDTHWLRSQRCGNATIHGIGSLSTKFGFASGCVRLCDMSTYPWSGTLKDPRSWAIVNVALASGIRHLGAWTAGNAGLSLARMVHAANCMLPPEKQIRVYCYAVEGALSESIKKLLLSLRADVVSLPPPKHGKIFSPRLSFQLLEAETGTHIPEHEYWDVSDGWDGVGLYMYRLLGRQLFVHERPAYVVAPVGTGNLLYGLYLGLRDCEAQDLVRRGESRIVGAVPAGESIVENFAEYGLEVPVSPARTGSQPPEAPKLATVYTPLLLTLYAALHSEDGALELVAVSKEDQDKASKILLHCRAGRAIAAEPSSLVAFGAVPTISSKIQTESRLRTLRGGNVRLADAPILVVNSGYGIGTSNGITVPDVTRKKEGAQRFATEYEPQ